MNCRISNIEQGPAEAGICLFFTFDIPCPIFFGSATR